MLRSPTAKAAGGAGSPTKGCMAALCGGSYRLLQTIDRAFLRGRGSHALEAHLGKLLLLLLLVTFLSFLLVRSALSTAGVVLVVLTAAWGIGNAAALLMLVPEFAASTRGVPLVRAKKLALVFFLTLNLGFPLLCTTASFVGVHPFAERGAHQGVSAFVKTPDFDGGAGIVAGMEDDAPDASSRFGRGAEHVAMEFDKDAAPSKHSTLFKRLRQPILASASVADDAATETTEETEDAALVQDHRAAHEGPTPAHTAADHEAPEGGFRAGIISHEHESSEDSVEGNTQPDASQEDTEAEDHRAAHPGVKMPEHSAADHEPPQGGFQAGEINHEHEPLDGTVQGGSQPEASIGSEDHAADAAIEGGAEDHRAAHPGVKMPPHTAADHEAPEGGFVAGKISHDHEPLDGAVQGGSQPEASIGNEDHSADAAIEEDHRAAHPGVKMPPHTAADHEAPEGGFKAGSISHDHEPLDGAVQGGSQPEASIAHEDHGTEAAIEGGAADHRTAHPGGKTPPHTAADHEAPEGGFQAGTISHDHAPLDAAVQGGAQPGASISHEDHAADAAIASGAEDHRSAHPGVKMPEHTAADHEAPEGGFQAGAINHDHAPLDGAVQGGSQPEASIGSENHAVDAAIEGGAEDHRAAHPGVKMPEHTAADHEAPEGGFQAGTINHEHEHAISGAGSAAEAARAAIAGGPEGGAAAHTLSRDLPGSAATQNNEDRPTPLPPARLRAQGSRVQRARERLASMVSSAAAGEGALGQTVHAAKLGALSANPSSVIAGAVISKVAEAAVSTPASADAPAAVAPADQDHSQQLEGIKPKVLRASNRIVDALRQKAAERGLMPEAASAQDAPAAATDPAAPALANTATTTELSQAAEGAVSDPAPQESAAAPQEPAAAPQESVAAPTESSPAQPSK